MKRLDYLSHFRSSLKKLKDEGRYRVFTDLERHVGSFPRAEWHHEGQTRPIVIWCSNDYLGMGQNPVVLNAMERAVRSFGSGAGGTRNISGNHHQIVMLEEELADLHHKQAALVFSSGYVANETALSTIATVLPESIIFSDEDNHASMIEGMRRSKAEKKIFKHNDPEHLRELLEAADPRRPKIVAFESVYSMDGTFAPLHELCDVADEFGALTYLDETHAVALYGARGGGRAEALGALDRFDVIQGGLGKGFGVVGGFVTGSSEIIDTIRSYGSGFIFTTALPPVIAAGAIASIRYLKHNQEERVAIQERASYTRALLQREGLPLMPTTSHIVPLLVGDSVCCKQVSDRLLREHGVYIQPINYPTVPKGTERLRITATPLHSNELIQELAYALKETWATLGLPLVAAGGYKPADGETEAALAAGGGEIN